MDLRCEKKKEQRKGFYVRANGITFSVGRAGDVLWHVKNPGIAFVQRSWALKAASSLSASKIVTPQHGELGVMYHAMTFEGSGERMSQEVSCTQVRERTSQRMASLWPSPFCHPPFPMQFTSCVHCVNICHNIRTSAKHQLCHCLPRFLSHLENMKQPQIPIALV